MLRLCLAGSLIARADDDPVTLPESIQGAQRQRTIHTCELTTSTA
jgi:hypothetical protein